MLIFRLYVFITASLYTHYDYLTIHTVYNLQSYLLHNLLFTSVWTCSTSVPSSLISHFIKSVPGIGFKPTTTLTRIECLPKMTDWMNVQFSIKSSLTLNPHLLSYMPGLLIEVFYFKGVTWDMKLYCDMMEAALLNPCNAMTKTGPSRLPVHKGVIIKVSFFLVEALSSSLKWHGEKQIFFFYFKVCFQIDV